MGGLIECYLDIASYYSYIAFAQILKNEELLKQHGVEIRIHPILLGAINAASGNKPPSTLPAKAAYLPYDMARAARAVGLPIIDAPEDLFAAARTQTPLRALHYIRATYPTSAYHATLSHLFSVFWQEHRLFNGPAELGAVLGEIPSGAVPNKSSTSPTSPLFTSTDITSILAAAASPHYKDALKGAVDEALERGAFGAPWFWVTTDDARAEAGGEEKKSEPFFGSDRWGWIYEFLGLPCSGVALLAPSEGKGRDKARL
ncbi:thioredoxin-like protein [Xylariaceae sp. FL0016]|nr:thioredoxin-like protein [Xylariaceae sp. FL0016]